MSRLQSEQQLCHASHWGKRFCKKTIKDTQMQDSVQTMHWGEEGGVFENKYSKAESLMITKNGYVCQEVVEADAWIMECATHLVCE